MEMSAKNFALNVLREKNVIWERVNFRKWIKDDGMTTSHCRAGESPSLLSKSSIASDGLTRLNKYADGTRKRKNEEKKGIRVPYPIRIGGYESVPFDFFSK